MTTGITARDRKLLYILGIIVIAALFFIIGIRPLNRKISKLDKSIADAQVEHDTIKMKLYQLDLIKDFKDSSEKKAAELSSRYYNMMVPADVDKLFTNKALDYGLKVNNLNIQTGKDPVSVFAYVNSEAYKDQERALEAAELNAELAADANNTSQSSGADLSADTSAEGSSNDGMVDIDVLASINQEDGVYNVADTTPAEVYVTSVILDVYGAHDKEQALLDDIIKNKALRVTAFQWTDMTTLPYEYINGELVQVDQENGNRMIINFDLYMYDGSEFSSMAAKDNNEVGNDTDASTSEDIDEE